MTVKVKIIVEEMNDPRGKYKVNFGEGGLSVFCKDGPETFGLICGFFQEGIVSVQHPLSIITGPLIYQGSKEFQEGYEKGKRIRKSLKK